MTEYLDRWGTTFPLLGPFLGCCYLVLAGVILVSAWKNRAQGWAVGLLLGFLLVSLPLWVMGLFYLTQWLGFFSFNDATA
jgi:hypothetical protein